MKYQFFNYINKIYYNKLRSKVYKYKKVCKIILMELIETYKK